MPKTEENYRADIVVVDDQPANLNLLQELLKNSGYKIRALPNGQLALKAIQLAPPDLILLDINMPGLSGLEVCKIIKSDPQFHQCAKIPIIFISALDEWNDKNQAFQVGGVDYITKPFQAEEVKARLETHLALRELQIKLEEKNQSLQQKCHELARLHQLRDDLTDMIAHDLRIPLTGIMGYLDLLERSKELTSEKTKNYLFNANRSTQSLLESINLLLDLSRMENNQMQLTLSEFDLNLLLLECIHETAILCRPKNLTIHYQQVQLWLSADQSLLKRVLLNLISNAVKYSPKNGTINILLSSNFKTARFEIKDQGPGIPRAYHQRIFEKFGQAEIRSSQEIHSSGLGLAFCQKVLATHQGEIGVLSQLGLGSTFWFQLPIHSPE